jgi:hypothetical protein
MRAKTKRRLKDKRWERYLVLAAEAGAIAMSLRDRPTRLDWLGVGLRALGVALKIHTERRQAAAKNPWRYFEDHAGEAWIEVPEEFRRLVLEHVSDVEVDEAYWDGDESSSYLCRGLIGGERVGWIGEKDAVVDGPYVLAEREAPTYRALGKKVWRRIGGQHLVYAQNGLALDPHEAGEVVPTAQMRALQRRLGRFLEAGLTRSCLLVGPPGTGKSQAIRWLVRHLGMTSVRVDLGVLGRMHGYYGGQNVSTSLETLLQLLRPEAMILDDLDRVAPSGPLLHFLELATRTCRLVLASANCVDKMMGAALRPGRFDDLVRFERLDPEVLRTLLGDDVDLFARLEHLPAAYVAEFLKRRRALGRAEAEAEIAELDTRRALAGSDDKDD